VNLEELRLVAGPARLVASGSLLGPRQDAQLALTDFPAEMLQPLYRALPALQVRPPRPPLGALGLAAGWLGGWL
jgi:hypothetical protein